MATDAELLKVLNSLPTQPFPPFKEAYLHKELAEYNTKALIGLEMLVELPCFNFCYEPAYFCSICQRVFPAVHVTSHVASKRHRKLFLASLNETVKMSVFLDGADIAQAAHNYELKYGRREVSLMFTRSVDQLYSDRRSIMPKSRFGDPTIASASLFSSLLEDDLIAPPLIKCEPVSLSPDATASSPSLETLLEDDSITPPATKCEPLSPDGIVSSPSLDALLEDDSITPAMKCEPLSLDGIANSPSLDPLLEVVHPVTPPVNSCESLSVKDLTLLPTRPFDSFERCFIHDLIASHRDAVVGAEIIVEMQCENARYEPCYFCPLCELRLMSRDVLSHVTGRKHRAKYLKCMVRDDEHLKGLLSVGGSVERLAEAAAYFEQKNGRKQVVHAFAAPFKHSLLKSAKIRRVDPQREASLPDFSSSRKRGISDQSAGNAGSASGPRVLLAETGLEVDGPTVAKRTRVCINPSSVASASAATPLPYFADTLISNSGSSGTMVAFKNRVSALELDDCSLINDAANTADAALHECSAEQLVALLMAERKAVAAQDRLIAKLTSKLVGGKDTV